MIYLMYWILFMNVIYVIHLMCWNYLIALIDLITHSRNRNNRNNSIHCNNKGGRARSAPPFVVAVNAGASVVSVSVLCDQEDQVVPAHQVDDIDEVHELDPVHQVDHKDERCDDIGRFWVDIGLFGIDFVFVMV